MKARNAFEASGNSPTHGHGVESVRRRIMEPSREFASILWSHQLRRNHMSSSTQNNTKSVSGNAPRS
jgi:hypothetical protein